MPGVQLFLQAIALGQQGGVFWRQIGDDSVETLPKSGGIDPCAGQHLLVDEAVQLIGYLQAMDLGTCGHENPLTMIDDVRCL